MNKINRPVYHVGLVVSDEEIKMQELYDRVLYWWYTDFEYPEYAEEYFNAMCMEYGVDEVTDMIQKVEDELRHG